MIHARIDWWSNPSLIVDMECNCGYMSRVPTDYAGYMECPRCGAKYKLCTRLEIHEVEDED